MPLDTMLTQALACYGMQDAQAVFLRHNENAVYRITAVDGRGYVLRIHVPHERLSARQLMHRADWLDGEMRFLLALSGGGLPVQTPVQTPDGTLLATLPGTDTLASLLTWVPGEPLSEQHPDIEAQARDVGRLFARMHGFVLAHPETEAIPRSAYDASRIEAALRTIHEGVGLSLFTQAMFDTLAQSGEIIGELYTYENRAPGLHGLIHADPGLGNLIADGGRVSPIDFGLCGHGPLLFDLGGLMGTFNQPHLRRAVLDGYEETRPLDSRDLRAIEGHFLLSIYLFMALHLRNPHVQEWFGRRLPVVIREQVEPFVQGEVFLPGLLGEA